MTLKTGCDISGTVSVRNYKESDDADGTYGGRGEDFFLERSSSQGMQEKIIRVVPQLFLYRDYLPLLHLSVTYSIFLLLTFTRDLLLSTTFQQQKALKVELKQHLSCSTNLAGSWSQKLTLSHFIHLEFHTVYTESIITNISIMYFSTTQFANVNFISQIFFQLSNNFYWHF